MHIYRRQDYTLRIIFNDSTQWFTQLKMDQAFNFIDRLTAIFLLHTKKILLSLATLSLSWREEINTYIYCRQDFTWRIIYNDITQWYTLLKMVINDPIHSLKGQ